MREVMDELLTWWREGKSVGVGTVVATWRSAPRPAGASMLVLAFFAASTVMLGVLSRRAGKGRPDAENDPGGHAEIISEIVARRAVERTEIFIDPDGGEWRRNVRERASRCLCGC